MNQLAEMAFTAYVGIDWADAKHDICVQVAGSEERDFDRIVHKPEKIEVWAQALYQRFGGPIAVALELTKGPIVSALQKYDFFVIVPIDPIRLAKYREVFTPSGAKDLGWIDRHLEKELTGFVHNSMDEAPGSLRYGCGS